MSSCRIEFYREKIVDAARNGSNKGLYQASAALMRMARQKIRFRKRKISKPGNPPYKHSTGSQSFSHSIRFAVDRPQLTAYVGPQKLTGKKGKNVPSILEFGGPTAPAANPAWYKVDGVPKTGLNSVAAISTWLLSEGYGPLFAANSESGVINQVARRRGAKPYSRRRIAAEKKSDPRHALFRSIQRRKNLETKKTIYYITVPLRSKRQADIAAANVVRHYNYPRIRAHYIARRPYMGPTLQEAQNALAKFFAGVVK